MGSVIFKKPPIKRLKKEGMFGVDMHFHTSYSLDAISRIPTAIKKAEKKGFGFAVTDHNEIRGAIEACKSAKSHNVLVIPGIETTCKSGVHMISYFRDCDALSEYYNKVLKPKMPTPFKAEIDVPDIIRNTKELNGIACTPHPFCIGAVGLHKNGLTKQIERALNLIEVINGYNFRRSNIKAAYWAASLNKGITGGSDGHATIELGKVLTFTKANDREDLFKELLKNRSVVVGREENTVLKAVMAIRKESNFLKRSKRQHLARKLIRSQLGPEYTYFKEKFKNGKMASFLQHHHIMKSPDELSKKK
jgi:hypothetical protein